MSRDLERRIARLEKLVQAKRRVAGGGSGVKFDFSDTALNGSGIKLEAVFDGDMETFELASDPSSIEVSDIGGTFDATGYEDGIGGLDTEKFFKAYVDIDKYELWEALNSLTRQFDFEDGEVVVIELDYFSDLGFDILYPGYSRGGMTTVELPYYMGSEPLSVHFNLYDKATGEGLGSDSADATVLLDPTSHMINLWNDLFLDYDKLLEQVFESLREEEPDVSEDRLWDSARDIVYDDIVSNYKNL